MPLRETLELATDRHCDHNQKARDAAYSAHLFHMEGYQVVPKSCSIGRDWPLSQNIAGLIDRVQYELRQKNKSVAVSNFVGMSIVRHCMRNTHRDDEGNKVIEAPPRYERVLNIAFAANDYVMDAKADFARQEASQKEFCIGELELEDGEQLGTLTNCLFLPLTIPERTARLAAIGAIQAFPQRGSLLGKPYIALHPGRSATETYAETIVTRAQLLA